MKIESLINLAIISFFIKLNFEFRNWNGTKECPSRNIEIPNEVEFRI